LPETTFFTYSGSLAKKLKEINLLRKINVIFRKKLTIFIKIVLKKSIEMWTFFGYYNLLK